MYGKKKKKKQCLILTAKHVNWSFAMYFAVMKT